MSNFGAVRSARRALRPPDLDAGLWSVAPIEHPHSKRPKWPKRCRFPLSLLSLFVMMISRKMMIFDGGNKMPKDAGNYGQPGVVMKDVGTMTILVYHSC